MKETKRFKYDFYLCDKMLNNESLTSENFLNSSELSILESKINKYKIGVPLLVSICLISVLANGYVLSTVRYLSRTLSPTLYFTLSLTAADAWVCLAMALSFVLHSYLPYVLQIQVQHSACWGLAYETIRMGAMITSVLHLFLLALNHYAGIARPLHYQSTVTPELAISLICVAWIVPPAILLIFFSSVPNQAFLSTGCAQLEFFRRFSFRMAVSSTIFVPLVAMFIIYIRIFVLIVKTRKRSWYNRRNDGAAAARKRAASVKAAITTSLIMGTFAVGWTPSVFLFLFICSNCLFDVSYFQTVHGQDLLFYLGFFSNVAIVLKSLLDPIIYAARVKEIKLAIITAHPYCFGREELVQMLEKMDPSRLSIRPTGSTRFVKPNRTLSRACREAAVSRSRHPSMLSSYSSNCQRRQDNKPIEIVPCIE